MSTPSGTDPRLLVRRTLDLAELVAAHAPRFTDPNKRLVFGLACPPARPERGALVYARWRQAQLPARVPERAPAYEMREDVFAYEPAPAGGSRPVVAWHLNFADPRLFVAYGGRLLAQDELQVLEHPSLGSLAEWLSASADPLLRPVTEEDGVATPVLIRGAPRRCALATDPDLLEGRPLGLYGNRFGRAKPDAVRRALTVLDPPTPSNILAMAAPPGGGGGPYQAAEIHAVLLTAYTGFRAVWLESQLAAESPAVVVHTGHWGCGAFGGDKVLMTILQLLAAQLAGLDALVHHTFDAVGTEAWREGKRRFDALPRGVPIADVERAVLAMGFVWGRSDGN
jgi:hypothetical protein